MATLRLLLLLLLGCGVAQSSKPVKVNSFLFSHEDAEEKACSAGEARKSSTSFPLMHIQAKCSPFRNNNSTWLSTMLESIKGDIHRYRSIASRFTTQEDADVPLSANRGRYIINLGFGTPQQSFYTSLDTGSDITWIPCAACTDCTGDIFDSSKSPTFKFLSCSSETCTPKNLGSNPSCGNNNCSFTETYGDTSEVDQVLSTDLLTVGSQSMPAFIFGCAIARRGLITSAPGLVGFGKGSLSFVSQTANLFDKIFSYCLPFPSSMGSLVLGKAALSSPGLQFTPLLSNAASPSFYYVGLNGVSVEEERVSVSSGKGTIIDSGTTITRLVEPAYSSLRDSFIRHLPNLAQADPYEVFDTCFNIPSGGVKVPQITLHFDNNMDVALQPDNVLFPVSDSVACLAFAKPPEYIPISIIGNYQQHNFLVVYDISGSRLGIAPENCDGS